jgi:spore germination cell wall hydrolase CwlJ-like protein
MLTHADYFMTSLCLWREARGEGEAGMTAVACVIRNRAAKHGTAPYAEVTAPLQFSSVTDGGNGTTRKPDPQLSKYPKASDPSWAAAQGIAAGVLDGSVKDVTGGATLYYDDSIPFPASWDKSKTRPAAKIGRLNFFTEL